MIRDRRAPARAAAIVAAALPFLDLSASWAAPGGSTTASAIGAVATACALPFAIRTAERAGLRRTVLTGLAAAAVVLLVAAAVPAVPEVVVELLHGAAVAFVAGPALAVVRRRDPDPGRVLGLCTAAAGAALLAGPPLGALLGSLPGAAPVGIAAAVVAAVLAALGLPATLPPAPALPRPLPAGRTAGAGRAGTARPGIGTVGPVGLVCLVGFAIGIAALTATFWLTLVVGNVTDPAGAGTVLLVAAVAAVAGAVVAAPLEPARAVGLGCTALVVGVAGLAVVLELAAGSLDVVLTIPPLLVAGAGFGVAAAGLPARTPRAAPQVPGISQLAGAAAGIVLAGALFSGAAGAPPVDTPAPADLAGALVNATEPMVATDPDLDLLLDCAQRRLDSRSPRTAPAGCGTTPDALLHVTEGYGVAVAGEVAVVVSDAGVLGHPSTFAGAGERALWIVAALFGLLGLLTLAAPAGGSTRPGHAGGQAPTSRRTPAPRPRGRAG